MAIMRHHPSPDFLSSGFASLTKSDSPGGRERNCRSGFTLIELAIVLVIIGLLAGGVLVGQHLIKAAEIRATISQIERYNTATNTFKGKYGALPGDIPATLVTQFGFSAVPTRGGVQGRGDGDGILEGYNYSASTAYTCNTSNNCYITGEPMFFWEDLSTNSGLIEGGFNFAQGFFICLWKLVYGMPTQ